MGCADAEYACVVLLPLMNVPTADAGVVPSATPVA